MTWQRQNLTLACGDLKSTLSLFLWRSELQQQQQQDQQASEVYYCSLDNKRGGPPLFFWITIRRHRTVKSLKTIRSSRHAPAVFVLLKVYTVEVRASRKANFSQLASVSWPARMLSLSLALANCWNDHNLHVNTVIMVTAFKCLSLYYFWGVVGGKLISTCVTDVKAKLVQGYY